MGGPCGGHDLTGSGPQSECAHTGWSVGAVFAGLAGMGKSTLHRIERGQRELSLSEIVALASALQIDPATLIILPDPGTHQEHTRAQNTSGADKGAGTRRVNNGPGRAL
jgi:transcriptional regulator with XRE-family HTH domain